MPTLTALTAQKRNKSRVNVYVDDDFFCAMSLEDAVKNKLCIGMDLTEAELASLHQNSDENTIFNKALVYILKSPKTENQVRSYLYKKDTPAEIVSRVISRLKTLNYINDEEYAQNYARAKSEKLGAKAIECKLRIKGINRDTAHEAGLTVPDQTELARSKAQKYTRGKDKSLKTSQQLYRYLLSKGFDFDLCEKIIEEYKNENWN